MYKKTIFDNGLRIITEQIPSRTVSVGVWVDVGARDEHDLNNGTAHFVEHMLFKGTHTRSPQQIAQELDVLGGMANAFTSHESTCYFATVLDSHLGRLVDLFSDFFLNSLFDSTELSREQQVILQEISMVEDTPDDQIHDIFNSLYWANNPLGNTILGSREVIASMDARKLKAYVKRFYTPEKIMIAAAGNIDHDEFVKLWTGKFDTMPHGVNSNNRVAPSQPAGGKIIVNKPLEQVHLVLGGPGLPVTSEKSYILMLLNIILGGNMSSRLFQEIREKRGLAYAVYSFLSTFADCGYLGIYLGTDQAMVHEAMQIIRTEQHRLKTMELKAVELANAKEFAKASMYLAAENMEARMTRLARNEFYYGRDISFEEVAAEFDRVTGPDIQGLACELLVDHPCVAAIGPVNEGDTLGFAE